MVVNYDRLYALRRNIEQLGFPVKIVTSSQAPWLSYVGFEVDGICSYGYWQSDEQVAINQAADKLRAVHKALVYWKSKSTTTN